MQLAVALLTWSWQVQSKVLAPDDTTPAVWFALQRFALGAASVATLAAVPQALGMGEKLAVTVQSAVMAPVV